MDVAEVDNPLAIETARYHRAVHQHRRLAAQRVAEAFAVILRLMQCRPSELVVLVQIDARRNTDAAARNDLFLNPEVQIERLLQHSQRLAVAASRQIGLVVFRQIPKPEGDDDPLRRSFLHKRNNLL
ncbi:hypothetical protein D3C86_1880410 [compost metagenome]